MLRRVIVQGLGLALLAACTSSTHEAATTTDSRPPVSAAPGATWLEEVSAYVESFFATLDSGSIAALGYFSPDAQMHWWPGVELAGWSGIETALRWLTMDHASEPAPLWEVRHVFVAADAVVVATGSPREPPELGRADLHHLVIGDDGVAVYWSEPLAGSFFGPVNEPAVEARTAEDLSRGRGLAERAAAETAVWWLYDHYPTVRAMEATLDEFDVPPGRDLLYADGAVSADTLRGLEERHGDGDAASLWPPGWELRPAMLADTKPPWPALTVRRPAEVRDAAGRVSGQYEVPGALGWYEVDTGDGCRQLALVAWELEGGYPEPPRIAAEQVFWDLDGLRACGVPGGGDVPAGWWATVADPTPLEERTAATYRTADGSEVALANTAEDLEALVAWGMGRFREAGLDEPHPVRIAFPPAQFCTDVPGSSGKVDSTPGGYVATVCFRAGEADQLVARWFLLHELGHVWTFEHLDTAARDGFTARAGLPAWDGVSVPYEDRAVEAAANVVAWGLLGGAADPSARLARWACDDVRDLFVDLTGVPPLTQCPG